ncbi:hypothetical protein B2J86_11205 [Acidovorax sp. SRB_14]|uniref:DUF2760 domain-containing protein n=1 Tax=Acidovorax sp. SRB_14 TaxID=1962699 RepID=UPI001567A82D|nr:DUF2760 domain-containing protein [Acidovorax sp. SRB_14]NMM81481.1 hypothetical protein [Acidovorax sp. SRB_14]
MTPPHPSLLSRIALAVSSFFSILARPEFAAEVARLRAGALPAQPPAAPVPAAAPSPAPQPAVQAAPDTAALQLLGLLQREARFVDFVEEDIAAYSDADIGAAGRVVHEGCRKVLREHFQIAPVRSEVEGSRITLPAGFDAAAVRLTGNVVGQAPFTGTLGHRGWRVTGSQLPQLAPGHDAAVVAQAEVEL